MRSRDRQKSKNIGILTEIKSFLKPYSGMVILAAFFLLFTSAITLSLGQGIRLMIDRGFISGSVHELMISIFIFIALAALLAVSTYFRHYFVSWLGEKVTTDIRTQVYKHTIYLHPSFFELNSASEIQSRLTSDITLLQALIGSSFSMALRNILMFIGGTIFLFLTNMKLSLIVFASVPFIMGPILIYGKRLRVLTRDRQKNLARIGSYINESLFNIKTVQAYNHQKSDETRFEKVTGDFLKVSRYRILFRSFFFGISIFFTMGSIAAMLYLGGRDVMQGKISGGELAAFIFYAFMIASSVGAISEVYGDLQLAAGATERLLELYRTKADIVNLENAKPVNLKAPGNIKIKNLNFSYANEENNSESTKQVLHSINLNLEAGKTFALVGPSGAGKTTLFDLLLRFYDPDSGEILFEGVNIKELKLEDYRNQIALVPQSPAIFSGSVADNIRYSKENATDEEVISAAKMAFAEEFILKMPKKYDSFLGENGERLSGGQKQRLAIARAFLKNPKILLLDEATNSLDAESEHQVQRALNKLTRNRTTLVIAHRIATVVKADKIFVIDNGIIVAEGKHSVLYRKSSLYRRFCDLQFQKPGRRG
ncbi:MAG: ATP-binding cassette domain-containing protein [Leptospiraceae bacterium]|nr:ATP-binding cassette domain-containing protein [Leptospiraceae bacterium]